MAILLQCLPAETLDAIASMLPARDIKSLRLVSRTLVTIALKYLFQTIFVEVLPESLEKLSSVVRHPVFSKSVRTIFFSQYLVNAIDTVDDFKRLCLNHLVDERGHFRMSIDGCDDADFTEDQWMDYHRSYNDVGMAQEDFLQTSILDSALSETFANCPRLDRVLTGSFYDPFDLENETSFNTSALKKVLEHTLLPPLIEIDPISALCCKLFMLAAACANIKWKTACFEGVEESFLDEVAIQSSCMRSSLSRVQHLRIDLCSLGNTLSAAHSNSLERLLGFMPMLRELNISVSGD